MWLPDRDDRVDGSWGSAVEIAKAMRISGDMVFCLQCQSPEKTTMDGQLVR